MKTMTASGSLTANKKAIKSNQYVVFWSPRNNPRITINLIVNAINETDAVAKAEKVTKSKAKKYVKLYESNEI